MERQSDAHDRGRYGTDEEEEDGSGDGQGVDKELFVRVPVLDLLGGKDIGDGNSRAEGEDETGE